MSDKDEDGKTVSGSKKRKVMDYIDGLHISDEAKDALYYAAGYKESTIADAPWNAGSAESNSYAGSGRGGKKGGGRKGGEGPAEGGAGGHGEGQADKALVFPCQRQRRKARQNGARHGAPR